MPHKTLGKPPFSAFTQPTSASTCRPLPLVSAGSLASSPIIASRASKHLRSIRRARVRLAHGTARRRGTVLEAGTSSSRPAVASAPAALPGLRRPVSSTATRRSSSSAFRESVDRARRRLYRLRARAILCAHGRAHDDRSIRSGHLLTASDDDVGEALTRYFREEGIDVETRSTMVRAERRDGAKASCTSSTRDAKYCRWRGNLLRRSGGRLTWKGLVSTAPGSSSTHATASMSTAACARAIATSTRSATSPENTCSCTWRFIKAKSRRATLAWQERRRGLPGGRAHTVFTDPQVAAVGASEKELQRDGIAYVSGRTISPSTAKRSVRQRPKVS